MDSFPLIAARWYPFTSPAMLVFLPPGPAKKIHVIVPPIDKDKEPKTLSYTVVNQQQLSDLLNKNRASLFVEDQAFDRFEELDDGGIYTFGGPAFDADRSKRTSTRVDATMVEIGCGQAVQKYVSGIAGSGTAHLHLGFIEKDDRGKPIVEIDAVVVHRADVRSPQATAYVVETANAPQPDKVEKLLDRVEKLQLAATSPSSRFHTCTVFVPVLGGRYWSTETTAKCKAHRPPIWRVKPSGALFEVRRQFSSSAIKGVTFFLNHLIR